MDSASSYTDLAKSLHEKATELNTHIETLKTANDELRDRCSKALTALSALCGPHPPNTSCSVCYTRERTHAFVNCGHGGFCDSCANRGVGRGRCHTCRGPVDGTIRIFL